MRVTLTNGVVSHFKLLFLLSSIVLNAAAEVDPIEIKGNRFFSKSNGKQFFIRGALYQDYPPSSDENVDSLADITLCRRDISVLSTLNINTIRTRYIDPSRSQSDCMNAFADAGIYVLSDMLWDVNTGIEPLSGYTRWAVDQLAYYTSVVDSLAAFPNMLGFIVGTSVRSDVYDSPGMPFFKAAIRDLKAHMQSRGHRDIPVGWFSVSIGSDQDEPYRHQYMTCDSVKADFHGIYNFDYDRRENHCMNEDDITKAADLYKSSIIPTFIAAHGCSIPRETSDNRTFNYVPSIYSGKVAGALSGGIADSYFRNKRFGKNYGLVDIQDKSVTKLPGFDALATKLAKATPLSINAAEFTPVVSAPSCPTPVQGQWKASLTLPPQPYEPLCSCMMNSLRCVASMTALEPFNFRDLVGNMSYTVCEGDMSKNCPGIRVDGGDGQYGAFSTCNVTAWWSWGANEYWKRHGDKGCDLNGTAELRDPAHPPTSECSFLLQQAGEKGEKTVTSFNLPTGAPPQPPAETHDRRTLRGGAIAGIVVGVGTVVAAPLFIFLCIISRKRKVPKHVVITDGNQDLPEYRPNMTESVVPVRKLFPPLWSPLRKPQGNR